MEHEHINKDSDDYSKRELDMKFQSLTDTINDNHIETLDKIGESDRRNHDKQETMVNTLGQINIQTTATNGRVRKLEKWQAGLVMAGAVTVFLGGILIGLVVYIYQYQLEQQSTRITNLKATVQALQTK